MEHSGFNSYATGNMDMPFYQETVDGGLISHDSPWSHNVVWRPRVVESSYDNHHDVQQTLSSNSISRSATYHEHSEVKNTTDLPLNARSSCPEECREECQSPECDEEDCNEPGCHSSPDDIIPCMDADCAVPHQSICTDNDTLCAGGLDHDVWNGAVQLHNLRPHPMSDHCIFSNQSQASLSFTQYPAPSQYSWGRHDSIHSATTHFDPSASSSSQNTLYNFADDTLPPHPTITAVLDQLCKFDNHNSFCLYHEQYHQSNITSNFDHSGYPNGGAISPSSSSTLPQLTFASSSQPTPDSSTPFSSPNRPLSSGPKVEENEEGPFRCMWHMDINDMTAICNLELSSREELQKHIEETHTATLSKTVGFICRWVGCSRLEKLRESSGSLVNLDKSLGFAQRSKLDRHIQSHTGYKASTCPTCHRAFSTPQTLECHMRTHTGEKPFPCLEPGCDYRAAQASQLTMHVRTKHTKVKPLRCPVCGQAFAESSNLSKHRKTHQMDEGCICDICGKTFRRKDQLSRHQKCHTRAAKKADMRRRSATTLSTSGTEMEESPTLDDNVLGGPYPQPHPPQQFQLPYLDMQPPYGFAPH